MPPQQRVVLRGAAPHQQTEGPGAELQAGGLRRLGRSAAISIRSDIAEETKITVKARRPVAQNTDIKIKSVKFSDKPSEEKDDGMLQWEFAMPPKSEKKLSIDFTVEFPKDRAVTGM